jgi:hypothetical protein
MSQSKSDRREQRRSGKSLTLRLVGLGGLIVFGIITALTWTSPISVERAARIFIEEQIEAHVAEKFNVVRNGIPETRIGRLAETLTAQRSPDIKALRVQLIQDVKLRIAATVTRMQDPGCACRARMRQALDTSAGLHIAALERAEPQLENLIEGNYGAIVADLLGDLRIFAATNMLAFTVLLALSVLQPLRIRQLFVPAILLCAASIATSLLYLFGQNWFFTILYADYVGYSYAGWMLLVYGLFCDIALFKARITTRIADALFSTVGAIPIPC